ncbi:helix-turn-helix domain-containing protein [Saccharopolyspora spinosa]|uniref:helix-turn-helix domain-containing protein n=1 Tax=Saccharopolyspora spinosa TaxID=60894 RepID=UPI000237A874|nr:helix-turn-helix transcriptional regulator [Saccharopolyspora spinosa]
MDDFFEGCGGLVDVLGVELRECRLAAGLTQKELAGQIGVSYVSVSRYETGTRSPKPEDVAQILATLGVTGKRYTELVDMARGADQPNWLETERVDSAAS